MEQYKFNVCWLSEKYYATLLILKDDENYVMSWYCFVLFNVSCVGCVIDTKRIIFYTSSVVQSKMLQT